MKERGKIMRRFRCPVCERKIRFVQKYLQSSHGRGLIECPSCKNKLRFKKYGTARANAYLIVFFAHRIFGAEKGCWPVYILLLVILDFVQKMRSPLLFYEPRKITRFPECAIDFLAIIVLVIYIVIVFVL